MRRCEHPFGNRSIRCSCLHRTFLTKEQLNAAVDAAFGSAGCDTIYEQALIQVRES
ncbi:MAG: hypothetical protein ACLVJ6_04135 [Merdibacter sp.]